MTDTSVSDAVVFPEDDGTGVPDGSEDYDSAGHFGLLSQHQGGAYVGAGLTFNNVDTVNEQVDIGTGHAFVELDSVTVQSGSGETYDTTLPDPIAMTIVLPTSVTLSLDTDATNDVYLATDPTTQDGAYLRHGSAVTEPTDPSVLLGTVNTSDGSTTRASDNASPTFDAVTSNSVNTGEQLTEDYPVADVKAHGAIGDGSTDDSNAIQAAVDSIGDNGVVYFGPGRYYLGSTVTVDPASVRKIVGEGAYLVIDSNIPALKMSGSATSGTASPSDSNNQNIKDEEMITPVEGLQIHSTASTYTGTGIVIDNTFGVTVTNCHLFNLKTGLRYQGTVRNTIIDDCHFWDNRSNHIHYDGVNLHQSIISDSHISYAERGIFVDDANVHNIHIDSCDIEGGSGEQDGLRSLIHLLVSSSSGDISQVQITGCSIEEHMSATGALVDVDDQTDTLGKIKLITITGNEFSGCPNPAIRLNNAREVTISGNTFWGIGTHAIYITGTSPDTVSITGNTGGNMIEDPIREMGFLHVDIGGQLLNMKVSDNTFSLLANNPIIMENSSGDMFIYELSVTNNTLHLDSGYSGSLSGYLVDVNAGSSSAGVNNVRVVGNQLRVRNYADGGMRVTGTSYDKVIIKDNIQRGSGSGTSEDFPAASAGNIVVADNLSD
jgi:hypothetical protein